MNKIYAFLFLFITCFLAGTLLADEKQSFPNVRFVGTGCEMKMVPMSILRPEYDLKARITYTIFLTEDDANTQDAPIYVCLNDKIEISLQGEEENSMLYSSGSGSQHGYRWEYDNGGVDNDVLMMTSAPPFISHIDFLHQGMLDDGWNAQKTSYQWSFSPKQEKTTTLTFKKYCYTNFMVRNRDGSSPWKEPVETIEFTINVTNFSKLPDDRKVMPWNGGASFR